MSHPIIKVNQTDVTRFLQSRLEFNQYNDESKFFYGVFRHSSLKVTLNNTSGMFDPENSLFPDGTRNNAEVEILYQPNNPKLNQFHVFTGVIDEGSTEDNLTEKVVTFTVVDKLKILADKVFKPTDAKAIDNAFGSVEIKLNQRYVENFLRHFLTVEGGLLFPFQVGLTCESIFPPDDSYYNSENVGVLSILNELLKATNSYAVFERGKLFINPRPIREDTTLIPSSEIIAVQDKTDGFNKIYNRMKINDLKTYTNQPSVEKYGEREINISIFAAPSLPLASSFFNYYSEPKREADLLLRMSNRTLALLIGDRIGVNIEANPDKLIKAFAGEFYVIARSMNFGNEIVTLRIREI